jgi:hypothetical protein
MQTIAGWGLRLAVVLACAATMGCVGGGIVPYDGGIENLRKVAVSRFVLQRCRNVVVDLAVTKPPHEYYLAPPTPYEVRTGAAKATDLVLVENADNLLSEINNWWTDEHGFRHFFGWGPFDGVEVILPKPRTKDDTGAAGSFIWYGRTKEASIPVQVEKDAKGIVRPISKPVMVCEFDVIT